MTATPATAATSAPPASPGYRAWVLFILIVVYTFNFIDRQILGILLGPIKKEFHFTDLQLGLLGGPAFALFYTFLAIPIAWLADRWSRTWIMTWALGLWSLFTAACGFVTSFNSLFLARMGVGVGEAGGVAPAYSLISDYFPARSRARALAIFSFGIPIGSALGVLAGGLIAKHVDWRFAFMAVGAAGLLLVPLFRMTLREPRRGGLELIPQAEGAKAPAFFHTLGLLFAKPSFWLMSFGASFSSLMGYGLIFWLPSFFQRSLHLSLEHTSWYYGSILLFGGVLGIWLGGWVADKLGSKAKSAYPLVPAIAFSLAIPAYIAAILSPSLTTAWFLFLIPQALALAWLGPVIAAVQQLVPSNMRTTASAAFLFINNLIGIGGGALFLGGLSDMLAARFGEDSLKYSILAGLGFYALSALLFFTAARTIRRDWVD